jgi:hypothetical protein
MRKDTAMRNRPNHAFSLLASVLDANLAPSGAVTSAVDARNAAAGSATRPAAWYLMAPTIAVTATTHSDVPWARCTDRPTTDVRSGVRATPPPAPMSAPIVLPAVPMATALAVVATIDMGVDGGDGGDGTGVDGGGGLLEMDAQGPRWVAFFLTSARCGAAGAARRANPERDTCFDATRMEPTMAMNASMRRQDTLGKLQFPSRRMLV